MYARAIDEAVANLRVLRDEERGRLAAAAVAMGLAVAATNVRPELAMPLFLGGLAVGALGVRALWRRWDLVDRLAGEPGAYVIAEVRSYASREATMPRRQSFAAVIRDALEMEPPLGDAGIAEELQALATELEDDGLALDPACAVACFRLLSDPHGTHRIDPTLSRAELRSRIRRIRSGFSPRVSSSSHPE